MDIAELNVLPRVARILATNGIQTVDEVVQRNPRELLALDNFGARSLTLLEAALLEANYELAADPYASYECAREGQLRGDAGLASLFLCGPCASLWEEEPFGRTPPAFVGETVHGHCLNCNQERGDIRLVQWFLCGNCERVARSIGRSVVAARALIKAWDRHVRDMLPDLELQDVDPPRLLRRTPEARQAKVASIDFVAVDMITNRSVLGIEMKGGKNYIGRHGIGSPIGQFQLDTSDCDDILTVVAREHIPVYLVHAQTIDRADPPTVRYAAIDRWWADLFGMEEHFDRVQKRPRETRMAAYYDTSMFHDFSDFIQHLQDGGPERVRSRLEERDWTVELYRA